jgi:hypothetical protein
MANKRRICYAVAWANAADEWSASMAASLAVVHFQMADDLAG